MYKPSSVEDYISHHEKWSSALKQLRECLLASGLEEAIKWQAPTYGFGKKNLITLAAFKAHCGLWFHQGSLLTDSLGVLSNAQEGKTIGMRHWKFTEQGAVNHKAGELPISAIQVYVTETIHNFNEGLEIAQPKRRKVESKVPPLLADALKKHKLLSHWEDYTLAKRREFCEYINTAKQVKTKERRVDKAVSLIEERKGLSDKYRK